MSMIGNFKRLSQARLDALMADPSTIGQAIGRSDDDDDAEPPEPNYFDLATAPDGDVACVEKGWHGLHWLLTGTAWDGDEPLNFIVAGEEIGEIDVGYGPARAHDAEAVRQISAALARLTPAMLTAAFDPVAMTTAEIYPQIWTREPATNRDDLLETFEMLRAFIAAAAAAGEAIVVWLD